MKIYIVGIGMDGQKTLTAEALAAISSADILIGAKRMVEPFSPLGKNTFISWKTEEIAEFIHNNSCPSVAVLMSGDCGFYSGAEKLISALSCYETEVISGISSPAYFCAKIKKPWQNMKFISLHGADGNIVRNVCRNEFCFFLLGGDVSPVEICRKLCEYGRENIRVYIGENLGYNSEKILSGKASDFTENSFGKLTVMVTENPESERGIAFGIPDNEFIRGSVPMTKSEVRSTVISKLDIGSKSICWDIGCGSGSVSVEMALQCFDGKVFALDKNSEAVELTRKNALKFGCDNVEIIRGEAPESLRELPCPDRVFIGGSCGKISEILSIIYEKNKAAKVVITAVSLETLSTAQKAFSDFGITEPEISEISVTRAKRLGNHTMLAAENPVFIIKGV
ncbi:MAG: precorrin-6y C5,15-methyltransferase (decarboxylating) subunit CbiE, partial [Ruminiclostridium sp.]